MPESSISVELAWVAESGVRVEMLRLAAGSTIAKALAAALAAGLAIDRSGLATSVFGRLRPAGFVLGEGDRVELTRALQVDPKVARRRRAALRRAEREREG